MPNVKLSPNAIALKVWTSNPIGKYFNQEMMDPKLVTVNQPEAERLEWLKVPRNAICDPTFFSFVPWLV
ncbi:hypothetical protein V6N13_088418 [Hibiscus sabdariffa]